MKAMLKRIIQAIKGQEDQKRLELISALLNEKVVLRQQLRDALVSGNAAQNKAEFFQRKYLEVKTEISHIRKRKTYYKKKCILMEFVAAKNNLANPVDMAV